MTTTMIFGVMSHGGWLILYHGNIVGGSDGSELKSGVYIGEGGGTVTIIGWDLERQYLVRVEVQHLGCGSNILVAGTYSPLLLPSLKSAR